MQEHNWLRYQHPSWPEHSDGQKHLDRFARWCFRFRWGQTKSLCSSLEQDRLMSLLGRKDENVRSQRKKDGRPLCPSVFSICGGEASDDRPKTYEMLGCRFRYMAAWRPLTWSQKRCHNYECTRQLNSRLQQGMALLSSLPMFCDQSILQMSHQNPRPT